MAVVNMQANICTRQYLCWVALRCGAVYLAGAEMVGAVAESHVGYYMAYSVTSARSQVQHLSGFLWYFNKTLYFLWMCTERKEQCWISKRYTLFHQIAYAWKQKLLNFNSCTSNRLGTLHVGIRVSVLVTCIRPVVSNQSGCEIILESHEDLCEFDSQFCITFTIVIRKVCFLSVRQQFEDHYQI